VDGSALLPYFRVGSGPADGCRRARSCMEGDGARSSLNEMKQLCFLEHEIVP
jgi:hypothetical protein